MIYGFKLQGTTLKYYLGWQCNVQCKSFVTGSKNLLTLGKSFKTTNEGVILIRLQHIR